jgi:hypothetical protein
MRNSTMAQALALVTIVGTLALLAPSGAEAIIIYDKFGLVGVVFDAGQAVQVNASHWGDPEQAPAPCDVLVEFLDGATGASLKMARLRVPSGQTQSADLGVTELVTLKGKVPIYARVTVSDPNMHPACGSPSLEVFDKGTRRTAAGYQDPNEKTAPEAFFPAFTLVTGLTLRFNAVNYGNPEQAPCPLLLTIFAADGTVLAQRRADVASGVGTFLDVGGFTDPWLRVRAAATRGVGGRVQKTLCQTFVFTAEVYDVVTGITTQIIGDPGL